VVSPALALAQENNHYWLETLNLNHLGLVYHMGYRRDEQFYTYE
jgi:hypothetical protein